MGSSADHYLDLPHPILRVARISNNHRIKWLLLVLNDCTLKRILRLALSTEEDAMAEKSVPIISIGLDKDIEIVWQKYLHNIVTYKDTCDRLEHGLSGFASRLDKAVDENEFLDVETAEKISLTCQGLLKVCQQNMAEDYVPYVLAAIDYFIHTDDSSPDFSGVDGFDDDVEVIEKTIQHFGLAGQLEKIGKKEP